MIMIMTCTGTAFIYKLYFILYLCIILSILFSMYYPLTSSISNGLLALYRSNERTLNTNTLPQVIFC